MNLRNIVSCLLALCFALGGLAQNEDTTFRIKALGSDDIVDREPAPSNLVVAASRMKQDVDELPVQAYVITQDDIRINGWTTLVDILKTIPGFRTSQPGSALLGETFTMRGLLGNDFAQIRINGLPIKPSGAPGMPIGVNLPIKQAERIEIVLGPATTLFGADAIAGVINIILPEVERPAEVMADVGIASWGQREMHLNIGGKLSLGADQEHIIRYSIFGSNREVASLKLDITDENFAVNSAELDPDFFIGVNDTATINNIPHASSTIGVSLKYRGLTLGYNTFSRTDHSALGAHPSEISYHSSSNLLGEDITQTFLQYEMEVGANWLLQSNASLLTYQMDEQSNYWGVSHPISQGRNFMFASSEDLYFEQLATYRQKKFSVLGGASFYSTGGNALFSHYDSPFDAQSFFATGSEKPPGIVTDERSILADTTKPRIEFENSVFSIFGQANYRTERFNLSGGVRFDLIDDLTRLSPKISGLYKISDKTRIRAFYGEGYRLPNAYYRHTNFRVVPPPPPSGPPPPPPPETSYYHAPAELDPEAFFNFEAGVIHEFNENLRVDVHFFHHVLENSLVPLLDYPTFEPDSTAQMPDFNDGLIGFDNLNSRSVLSGLQGKIRYRKGSLDLEFAAQINRGYENLDTIVEIDNYRRVPLEQFNLNIRLISPNKSWMFGAFALYNSYALEQVVRRNDELTISESSSYYNLDLLLSKQLSEKLSTSLKVTNAFDNHLFGLYSNDLTGENFNYMPQLRRMYHIRLTYNLR